MTKALQDQSLQQQIAWDILQEYLAVKDPEIAWVTHKNKVYYSILPKKTTSKVNSAVTKLIQNIFEVHIDQSFFILRNRIFSNVFLTESARGMIRIAAKRAEAGVTPRQLNIKHGLQLLRIGDITNAVFKSSQEEILQMDMPRKFDDRAQVRKVLNEIESKISRGEILHDHNRKVAVIAVDSGLNILGWSANSNSKNKTLHAEVRLIQGLGMPLPRNAEIFVSLKPCKMCAAMIAESAEDPKSIRVYYLENDPGALAQRTMLDKIGVGELWT